MVRTLRLLGVGSLCLAIGGCATGRDVGAPAARYDAHTPSTVALTLDTRISRLNDDPRGRAVLDRDLPTLLQNPSYFLFEGMSLRQLASKSGGRISQAKLDQIQVDLAATSANPANGSH